MKVNKNEYAIIQVYVKGSGVKVDYELIEGPVTITMEASK